MTKTIKFNRQNKDFDAYLNNEYVGSFASHHEAEIELDRIASDLLGH